MKHFVNCLWEYFGGSYQNYIESLSRWQEILLDSLILVIYLAKIPCKAIGWWLSYHCVRQRGSRSWESCPLKRRPFVVGDHLDVETPPGERGACRVKHWLLISELSSWVASGGPFRGGVGLKKAVKSKFPYSKIIHKGSFPVFKFRRSFKRSTDWAFFGNLEFYSFEWQKCVKYHNIFYKLVPS